MGVREMEALAIVYVATRLKHYQHKWGISLQNDHKLSNIILKWSKNPQNGFCENHEISNSTTGIRLRIEKKTCLVAQSENRTELKSNQLFNDVKKKNSKGFLSSTFSILKFL